MSYEDQVSDTIKRLVSESLRDNPTLEQVFTVVEHASAACEHATSRALTLRPPSRPIACQAGCAWCCTERIHVTPAEALRIAAWLRENVASQELAALRERLAEVASQTNGLTWQEHVRLRIPCPLLKNNFCSVHVVRPLVCRSHNSLDSKQCERHMQNPSEAIVAYKPQQEIANGTAKGLNAGLAAAGLDGEFVELVSALRTIFDNEEIDQRWLDGERLF